MARRGDGMYLRGKTWWLDCVIHGKRYQLSLGRRISRSAALEVASIRRAQILKGEAGIRKPKDIAFREAKDLFLKWLEANKRANTVKSCKSHMKQFETSPLSAKVVNALKETRKTSTSDHVFVNREGRPFGSVRTAFTTACSRANLSGVSPHVLRHTFATRLREEGVSDGTIQALGRWKEPKMVRRYAHVNDDLMKKALEQIAENSPTIITTPRVQRTRKSKCARSSVG